MNTNDKAIAESLKGIFDIVLPKQTNKGDKQTMTKESILLTLQQQYNDHKRKQEEAHENASQCLNNKFATEYHREAMFQGYAKATVIETATRLGFTIEELEGDA